MATTNTDSINTQQALLDILDKLDYEKMDRSLKIATEGNLSKKTKESYESYLNQADEFIDAYSNKRFADHPEHAEFRDAFDRVTSKSTMMILSFIHFKCLLGGTGLFTNETESAPTSPPKKRKVTRKGKGSKASTAPPDSFPAENADGEEGADFYADEDCNDLSFPPTDLEENLPENMPNLPELSVPDIPELQNDILPSAGPSVARTIQAALRWRFLCRYKLVRRVMSGIKC